MAARPVLLAQVVPLAVAGLQALKALPVEDALAAGWGRGNFYCSKRSSACLRCP